MLPSSSSPAIRTQIAAIAPAETPANRPSSCSSRWVQTIASRFETMILRSSRVRSMIGGMKPSSSERRPWTSSPCIGSAATIFVSGSFSFSLLPTPISVPPVPSPATKAADLVELVEDLDRGAVVMGAGVRLVAVLVGHVVRGIGGCHLERQLDGAIGALRPLRVDDLGAEHAQQLGPLLGHVVGHHHLDRIALAPADHRQRDAGVARGRLEDRLPRLDRPLGLGGLDHRLRDPVLDRAGRVAALELGEDPHARLRREPRQLDQRRVADRLDHVAVAAAAGAVERRLEHRRLV